MNCPNLYLTGVPDNISESDAAIFRSKILSNTQKILEKYQIQDFNLTVSTNETVVILNKKTNAEDSSSNKLESLPLENDENYSPKNDYGQCLLQEPLYEFSQLILAQGSFLPKK